MRSNEPSRRTIGESGRIRIVRVIARLNVGGPARHTVILDAGLRACGFDTLLVHGAVANDEAQLEALADQQRVPRRHIPTLGRRIRPWDDLVTLVSLFQLIRTVRPDIVHTHTAKAGALGRIAAAVSNVLEPTSRRAVIVHTFHGHVLEGYFGPLGNRLVRAAEWLLARLADRVVAISESQRKDLVDRFNIVPRDRIRVIPLGLELRSLVSAGTGPSPIRDALGFRPDDIVIGYVGRFAPIKNVPLLIRAYRELLRIVPRVRLMLVGDGTTRPEAERLVAASGLESSVRFLGWREDIRELYRAMDVFVLVSRNEGTPVALIEAMAAGVPVISTDVGGVRDLLVHARTGTLVPPDDERALIDALAAVLQDLTAARVMAASARGEIVRRFAPERLVCDIAEMYRSALQEKRSGVRE